MSPVIAVILMVAITVVLAATVFVLVSDIGGNKGSAPPTFSLNPDEGLNKLSIQSAGSNADWNRLVITATCTNAVAAQIRVGILAGTHVNAPGTATGASTALQNAAAVNCADASANIRAAPAAAKMVANDYLQFCATTGQTPTNVHIVLTDTTSNALAYEYTFTNVEPCGV